MLQFLGDYTYAWDELVVLKGNAVADILANYGADRSWRSLSEGMPSLTLYHGCIRERGSSECTHFLSFCLSQLLLLVRSLL